MTTLRPGRPTKTAAPDAEQSLESMAAIRSLLHDQPPEKADAETRTPSAYLQSDLEQGDAQPKRSEKHAKSKIPNGKHPKSNLLLRLLGHDLAPKIVLVVSILLIVYLRPWLIGGVVFFTCFLIAALFLILGHDRFWRRAMTAARWYAQRNPSRATVLHRKLDSFAMRWDAVLDRFPEGSVDGLYLPDFGEIKLADARHDAALDRRFSQMQEN